MTEFLLACWSFLGQLSPWLLIGLVLSAVLHVALPADFVRRRFRGTSGVLQAVAIGVPLPLCSCGVIPTGIGLKNEGAEDGAAVGFLISTPQTGVDSILVSVSFFGWPFAIFKMVAALVLGVVGGWLTNLSSSPEDPGAAPNAFPVAGSCCEGGHSHVADAPGTSPWWKRGWAHCLEILASIWFWLVVGILISALIQVVVPQSWVAQAGELGNWGAMLLVLLISVPLYVCATASVPMAAALVAAGFPPAAALVFLMAGPATNTSTMGAIYARFGKKVLAIYLLVIIAGSLICGWLFNYVLDGVDVREAEHLHAHGVGSWTTVSSIIMLGLLAYSAWYSWGRARKTSLE